MVHSLNLKKSDKAGGKVSLEDRSGKRQSEESRQVLG